MIELRELWAVMKTMYPHAFKEYGGVDGPTFRYWERELKNYNLAAGYQSLQQRSSEFPPTLPEFKQLCRAGKGYHHPQNCSDQDKAAIESSARKLLAGSTGSSQSRIITRGQIKVFQKKRGEHWYDQYPQGLTRYNLDEIYGADLELIRPAVARHDDDTPVRSAA
ncbi:hypothetical protein F3N42_03755 [Marinihelvus fidelis]|uniref:Uncharacterized protein n=1 Tax=Marinihelvus fidelis TaxID=2613842 RepID=A0A5N0TH65_9GAMM|nr:hypothetical protein [Marinihelvus fidelis]KAA9133477.1 hypothetical protein F3N42_03755 [Marinihelvus fidelis]